MRVVRYVIKEVDQLPGGLPVVFHKHEHADGTVDATLYVAGDICDDFRTTIINGAAVVVKQLRATSPGAELAVVA